MVFFVCYMLWPSACKYTIGDKWTWSTIGALLLRTVHGLPLDLLSPYPLSDVLFELAPSQLLSPNQKIYLAIKKTLIQYISLFRLSSAKKFKLYKYLEALVNTKISQ